MKKRYHPAELAARKLNTRASVPARLRFLATALASWSVMSCGSAGAEDGASEATPPVTAAAAGTPAQPDQAQLRQMQLMSELQAIDQALVPLREQALEDAEIRAEEQALVAEVDAAMEDLSPGVLEARDRFEELRGEYDAAQEAGEEERVQTLGAELQGLQVRIQQTQNAVLAQEGVAESIETFRERLFDWMRATDPAADSLLNRAEEISDALQDMTPPAGN